MRRLCLLVASIIFVIGTAALLAGQTESPTKGEPRKSGEMTAAQPVHHVVTGRIMELTDTSLKLRCAVTEKVETMTFALEKPLEKGVAVGDVVTVTYSTKDGQSIAAQVVKPSAKPPYRAVEGKVTELSDTALKLEWMEQGKPHTSEFILDKPLSGIAVGFKVKVVFYTEGEKHHAVDVRIPESPAKKAGASETAKAPKAAEPKKNEPTGK